MQSIYAYEQDAFPSDVAAEKNLQKSIAQAFHLFLYHLYIFDKIGQRVLAEAEIKASKHFPTEEDKNFSTRLANNPVITALKEDETFNRMIKNFKLNLFDDGDVAKGLLRSLLETKEYAAYCKAADGDLKAEADILLALVLNVMPENELWLTHLEEHFSNWEDDQTSVKFKLKDWLERFNPKKSISKLPELGNTREEIDFAKDLYDKTNLHKEEFMELIEPKLKNWDLDRIAAIDMILMKMALCELLYFSHIPVKVTINEYIDISKLYSTPKSKDFINGVLDKLMRQLNDEGKIQKTGRGLQG